MIRLVFVLNNQFIQYRHFVFFSRNLKVDAVLPKFPAISGTPARSPFFFLLLCSLVREIVLMFSTTSPLVWTLSALLASERAIVGHSDTIPPWRAFSGAVAVDRRGTPGSSRSSRIVMQSSPWVDRRDGSSSSAFWLRHAAARSAEHFLRTEDSPRDAGRAATVSSAAPDESSLPGSCTPPTFPNFPTRGIGNPKIEKS